MTVAETIEANEPDAMREHAARIRASGILGRSSMQLRLFDFLLAASLEGRAPKETEIAEALLSRGGDFDGALDGSVRVAVHRLRRKLEDFYASHPEPSGARLIVPRGSYRLEIVHAAESTSSHSETAASEASANVASMPKRGGRARSTELLIALLALLAVTGWAYSLLKTPAADPQPTQSALWAPLADSKRPTTIVVGDFYIFGESDEHGQVQRLVREFAVNSRADLDEWLMFSPEKAGRYRDLHLSYLPTGTAAALGSIIPIVDSVSAASGGRPRVISMSELTPEILKANNIVYVGYLSRLGLLRNALFAASRFEVGTSYDELVDEKSRTRYVADGPVNGNRAASRDLAYLSAFPGPSGNRVVVIAGARDAALMQAAEVAADPAQMSRVAAAAEGSNAFEALYEVGALGNLNVAARLTVAGPMRADAMWSDPADPDRFPDELTSPAR